VFDNKLNTQIKKERQYSTLINEKNFTYKMKILLVKQLNSYLAPAYDEDKEKLKRVKVGEIVEVTYKKPRNIKFHKLYFALIQMVFDNTEIFDNKDDLRYWLTMKAGFYEEIKTPNGMLYTAKSIKFESMDELEFKDLFDKSVEVIEKQFGWESEEILNNLNDFM
jgi:hypothetical protein